MISKRGGAIAEAAIVFPVVISVVVTVIYILIAMYTEASYAARDHIALRAESGRMTETVERENWTGHMSPLDRYGRKPFVEQANMAETGVRNFNKKLWADNGRLNVVDEAEFIRMVDCMKRVAGGIVDRVSDEIEERIIDAALEQE